MQVVSCPTGCVLLEYFGLQDYIWHVLKNAKIASDLRQSVREVIHHNVLLFCFPQPIIGQSGVPQGPSGQKIAVVTVDDCDTSVALRFGHVIGNYTCSAQGSQSGSKK